MSLENEYRATGRLVADPEYIEQANKTKFRIAINETYKKNKIVTFMNCVAFGSTAEYIYKYAQKGDRVHLRGPIRSYTYETSTGERRNEINILIDEIKKLDFDSRDHQAKSRNDQVRQSQPDKFEWPTYKKQIDVNQNDHPWKSYDPNYFNNDSSKTIVPKSKDYDPF